MDGIRLEVNGNIAKVIERPARITAGTVGLPVEFSFDSQWDGLSKTAVFRAGFLTKIVENLETETTVPWEVLALPKAHLSIGVYGVNKEGSIAIPTIWCNVCAISAGVNPDGDPSTEPSLPVWQKLWDAIGDLSQLETEDVNNLVAAINEANNIALAGGIETDPTLSIQGKAAEASATGSRINDLESTLRNDLVDKSGGTFGAKNVSYKTPDSTSQVAIYNGAAATQGAGVWLYGKDHASNPGVFRLQTYDATNAEYRALSGYPNGDLKWNGVNVYTEKNRPSPDRNLLDNSDFRNPVNRIGLKQYVGNSSPAFTIDRWRTNSQACVLDIKDGYISMSNNTGHSSTATQSLRQELIDVSKYIGKNLTFVAKVRGTQVRVFLEGIAASVGDYADYPDWTVIYRNIYVPAGTTYALPTIQCPKGYNWDCEWAALYEGEFTAETLPEYSPRSFAEEMAICEQYDPYTGKARYTQVVEFGALPSGTASTLGSKYVQLDKNLNIISIDGYLYAGENYAPLSPFDGLNGIFYTSESGKLYAETSKNVSGWSAVLVVKYTK